MSGNVLADPSNDVSELFQAEQAEAIKHSTVSGAMAYFLRTGLVYGMALIAESVLAVYLHVAEFAIFNIVTQIFGILTFFSDIGLASTLIQKKSEPTTAEYRTVFTIQQILSWLIFIVTLIIALSKVLQPKIGFEGELVLLALGLSFPLASLKTIPSIMLERHLQFNKLVIPQIVEQVFYNSILIGCVVMGVGVRSFTYAILARSVVGVITIYAIKMWPIGFSWDKTALKELIGSGSKFQLNDFLARIKDQLFTLSLGLWLPINQFGYISFAQSYSQVPYTLTVQNVIAITFPTYSRLQNDKQLLKRAIEKTLFFISLSIFPLLIGMCVFITPLLSLVPKLAKWQPAIMTFILFTLSIGGGAISTPLTNTLSAVGKINTTLKLMIFWLVITWILTPLCIHFFGFNGVGIATLLIAFTSVLPIYFVNQIVKIDVWGNIWRQGLAASLMAGTGVAFMSVWSKSFPLMISGMAVTSLVYAASLALFGREKMLAELNSLRKKR